jgi:signal transduction histidine kinase
MERIIKDVLTLARGDRALTLSPAISLDRVATNAWDTVDTHGASLTIEEDLFAVEADPDRLQRLFENLFRNAVEHAARDSHTVADDEAPSASQPDSTDRATPTQVRVGQLEDGFFVSDDGQGIPPVDGERIFEPGYSNADGGTGLGLPIVERIAVAHGWTVSLAESADGGARFEFSGVEPEST